VPRASKKPRVCGALVQNADFGRVDVCGLESGHDQMLNATPHEGMYRGMKWETHRDLKGRPRYNIIDQGRPFDEERLEGGAPVPHEVQRHMIDKAKPLARPNPPYGERFKSPAERRGRQW
jgi:hypothetical protein